MTGLRLSFYDAKRHGNGPAEGTLGLTWIDWSQLREIKTADD